MFFWPFRRLLIESALDVRGSKTPRHRVTRLTRYLFQRRDQIIDRCSSAEDRADFVFDVFMILPRCCATGVDRHADAISEVIRRPRRRLGAYVRQKAGDDQIADILFLQDVVETGICETAQGAFVLQNGFA